jgi:hypothetical protein
VFDAFWARQSTPAPDPACPAPRQAVPASPARARAYKSPSGVDRTPPRTLDLTRAQNHRRLPRARRARDHPSACHRRSANRAFPSHARPLEETVHAFGEAPRARNRTLLHRRSQSSVAGLRPTASECRPGKSLPHSSIPCAHSLYITPWSSSCHLIELDHCGLAGTPAADEITLLRTWTGRFRPPPPSSRTPL